jgi:uncharacterized peroxidase-related enzyme
MFKVHTIESAPDGAKETLVGAQKAFGFVPNLLGTMAGAPALLKAYLTVTRLFDESSLSASERQVVLLAVSAANQCEYCLAAHTAIASMQRVPADVIAAAREGRRVEDPRLEALRLFATAVTERRGHPTVEQLNAFRAAGYSDQQVLEVVLGVGMKTLSNYTNHIAGTPIDAVFADAIVAHV